jgi:hypothetical protein
MKIFFFKKSKIGHGATVVLRGIEFQVVLEYHRDIIFENFPRFLLHSINDRI